MTTLLDIDAERAFEEERHQRLLIAVRLAALASILALAGFAVFDSVWEVGIWHSLLYVRTLTLGGLLIILLLSFTHWAVQRVDMLAILACLFFSSGIVMVAQMAGGGVSIYRDPLYITFVGFTLLVPWTPRAAAWCFATVVAFYNLLYAMSGAMGYLSTWLMTNLMLCTGAIIATFSVSMIHRLRRVEFGYRRRLRSLDAGLVAIDGLDQVFPNITREMRGPMALFTGPLEALLTAPMAEVQRQQVEIARRNAVRFIRLVDETLARALLVSASIPRVISIDVAACVRTWLEELDILVAQKRVRVALEGNLDEPMLAQGDTAIIDQAVGSMLAYAINQAKSGGTVTVQLSRDPGHIVLTVQDNGVGRAGEELRTLLNAPDDTVLPGRDDTLRRSRISLAAARNRLQAMDAELSADSTLGRGTTLKLVMKR